ncbi:MAG: hypothetical protein ACHQ4G_11165 [Opitutales bacterium]
MNKPWKVILAFLGVFVAGAVFGGFVSLRWGRGLFERGGFHGPAAIDQFAPMIMRRLTTKLELSQEQTDKIRPIVKTAEEKLRQMRHDNFAASIAVAEQMNSQVAAILTPEQNAKLETMRKEMQERWRLERQRRNAERAHREETGDGDHPPAEPAAQPPAK